MTPISWRKMVLLHYDSKGSKKELIDNLKDCWKQARISSPRVCSDAYDAMEELYYEYKEDCMRIIIFSMRNRREMKFKESDLIGLKKCINEWDSQSNPRPKKDKDTAEKRRRDSLTELILSYEELRERGVYMIAATVQRVRRLRKATDGDMSVLSYSNSQLDWAWKIWEEEKEKIKKNKDNFMAAPNEMSDIVIIMQRMLNQARLAKIDTEDYDYDPDELIERVEKYQEGYDNDSPQYVWSQAYLWWFQRIKFRRAQKTLDFLKVEEIANNIEEMEFSPTLQKYLDSILESKNTGKEVRKDFYYRLEKYHDLIASFMHNPTSDNKPLKRRTKWKVKTSLMEKRRYLELAAFPGGTRLRKQKVHQFIETTNLSPIRIVDGNGREVVNRNSDYSAEWREDHRKSSLIQKCRVSISNSLLMTLNIGTNNSHIAPATLILNAIDLMVKVRWFLSTRRIYRVTQTGKQAWTLPNVKGKTFREDHEFKISNEIKDGLILALGEIESELGNCGADVAREPISEWVKSLKDLQLEDSKSGISSLGQLCNHCGILVGWEWQDPRKDTGRERRMYEELDQIEEEMKNLSKINSFTGKRNPGKGKEKEYEQKKAARDEMQDEIIKMQRVLLLKDSTGIEMLRIDTADDNLNPYFKPVGEISAHQ